MASKRVEERNEKIIRGLMKLPPNRRCINCNSLGPQYVCTNFWTFICMICSGIHREFTHRVKSVSMSKFTSEEVEALQNGGNQRAREVFLKNWDLQRQRMPNSSNVDKVREFIKAVYVERKYAGGSKSEKPPRDIQSPSNTGEDARRASSYHSYSQSPPYDFQYEERLKRNQGGSLTRKPGSDRGLYERKTVSFIYSPGSFSDHMYEDRFANEGSSSRVSDYSVSSGGDPFRSGPQSPNVQKDGGFSSPIINSSSEIVDGAQRQSSTNSEAHAKRDADRVPVLRPQRTVSAGSFGSFDSNSVSLQSIDSGSSAQIYSEPSLSAATIHDKVSASPFLQPSTEDSDGLNLFKNSYGMPTSNSVPVLDLFQAPAIGSTTSADMFLPHVDSSALSKNFSTLQTSQSSPLNEVSEKSSFPNLNQNLPEPSDISNEGWATFDLPHHNASVTSTTQDAIVSTEHSERGMSYTSMSSVLSSNVGMQWADFQTSTIHGPPLVVSNPWHASAQYVHGSTNIPSGEPWKAFEEDNKHQNVDMQQDIGLQASVANPYSTIDQYHGLKNSEGSTADVFRNFVSGKGASFPTLRPDIGSESFNQPIPPFMSEIPHIGQKSGNPFDIDSELEVSNALLDTSSLQTALPNMPLPPPYVSGVNESWFPSNSAASQGGMSYASVPVSSSLLPNVPTPGPLASIGGNPFA